MSPIIEPPVRPEPGLRIWANGRLYDDPDQAVVPANDHGLVVGDGVFEALKITPAGPFAVRRHLERLSRSAAAMGLPAPDHGLLREAVAAVVEGWGSAQGKLRITYTAGPGPLGSQAAHGPVNLIVAAAPVVRPAAPTTAVVTAPWVRNERGALTGVKSTSYAENVRALAHAAARGAGEAIFANSVGDLCEGTGTNIFCVFSGEVATPPLSSGPLRGVTRDLILEWYPVVERAITMAEVEQADEVFLSSSMRDVQGVVRFDDRDLPAGRPLTAEVARVFAARSGADPDP
jgi:branched-chain amino acid aminotransferase